MNGNGFMEVLEFHLDIGDLGCNVATGSCCQGTVVHRPLGAKRGRIKERVPNKKTDEKLRGSPC